MSCDFPNVSEPAPAVQSLRYGDSRTAIAWIVPDEIPALWRVVLADGRSSDPMILTRAKDAALALAVRGPPARNPTRFRWRQDRSESHSGARRRVRAPTPSSKYPDARSQPKFLRVERAWRVVAGPDVPEINLSIPLDPELAARQERTRVAVEEHKRKTRLAAARKAMRITPMLDPDPAPAVLHPSAPIPADDPFEIPAFLDRTRFAELEKAA